VVNVALSERGRERLDRDFANLCKLNEKSHPSFVPEVYFKDEQAVVGCNGIRTISGMFLGEWFDGFHEFHLTEDVPGSSQVVLWDFSAGYQKLTEKQALDIYRKAAFILTWHYNLETCEEIFPWHHASGDFVAKVDKNAVDVRLITVRQYASRAFSRDLSAKDRVSYLLLFLANLTIRMRLDRFDGTGDIAWAGPGNLKACIGGFLDALKRKAVQGLCDPKLASTFTDLARSMSPGDLTDIFQVVF
jgi:hypothetical protein